MKLIYYDIDVWLIGGQRLVQPWVKPRRSQVLDSSPSQPAVLSSALLLLLLQVSADCELGQG